jgi:Smg protein
MYEILVYLFENCQRSDVSHDRERVARRLSAAGFEDSDIHEALSWLAGVVRGPHRSIAQLPDSGRAIRVYAPRELGKLDAACRGFLLSLEQQCVLNAHTREHVIERALAAAGGPLSLEQLKLVVLMVLWNEPTPAIRLVAEDLLSPLAARLPN